MHPRNSINTTCLIISGEALGYSLFTQGDTEEELKLNILDAIKCHFVRDEVLSCA
jgi:hypothetical protein